MAWATSRRCTGTTLNGRLVGREMEDNRVLIKFLREDMKAQWRQRRLQRQQVRRLHRAA